MTDAAARQTVATFIEAWNSADQDKLLSLMSDDVAFDFPGAGREIGKDKLRWTLGEQARHGRDTLADVAVMMADGGGRAAAEVTLRGRDPDGASYAIPAGLFFEIDDSRITRFTFWYDRSASA